MKQLSLIWVFRLWTLQTLPMNMLDTLFLSFQTEGGIKDPPRDLLVNILREVELQYAKVSLFLYQLAWKNIWQEEKQLAQMQWFSFLSVTIRREAAHIKGRTFMMCPCDSVNKSFVAVCAGQGRRVRNGRILFYRPHVCGRAEGKVWGMNTEQWGTSWIYFL